MSDTDMENEGRPPGRIWSIQSLMACAIVVLLAVASISGWSIYTGIRAAKDSNARSLLAAKIGLEQTRVLSDEVMPLVQAVSDLRLASQAFRHEFDRMVLEEQGDYSGVDAAGERLRAIRERLMAIWKDQLPRDLLEQVDNQIAVVTMMVSDVREVAEEGTNELLQFARDSRDALDELAWTMAELDESLDTALVALERDAGARSLEASTQARASVQALDDQLSATQTDVVLTLVVVIGTALLLQIGFFAILRRRLGGIARFVRDVSDGDLSVHFDAHADDELGQLTRAMEGMVRSLSRKAEAARSIAQRDLQTDVVAISSRDFLGHTLSSMVDNLNDDIRKVAEAAGALVTESERLSGSSADLSRGAAEQASTVGQIAATIEQLSLQVRRNAESAQRASEMVTAGQTDAQRGWEHLRKMMADIESMSDASEQVSTIATTIDEIAFQTNLLALNAAIEAARVGDAGSGFMVVAREVRNLARRCAEAAGEAGELIAGSVGSVKSSAASAQETADALEQIITSVSSASELVGEIAEQSNQQATGIEDVSDGLRQIKDVTKLNAGAASQGASSSKELSLRAQQLQAVVADFRLKDQRSREAA